MPDIKALRLLSDECTRIKSLSKPPTDYAAAASYRKESEKTLDKTYRTVQQVQMYGKEINGAMDELRKAIKGSTKVVQDAISKTLDSLYIISVSKGPTVEAHSNVLQCMQYVQELQQLETRKQRLEEFTLQTQIIIDNVSENFGCTLEDLDLLKGYLDSWKRVKDENYEEEKARLEKERRERERQERKRKEEAKRKKKKEEERKRQEREERKRQEQEELKRRRQEREWRKEEEEKLRREEEERLKRREEERKRKKEKERKRQEEEREKRKGQEELERQRQEEERRKEEEERLRREEEERLKRKEEEQKKKEENERKRQEEEERKRMEQEELERQRLEEERRREEEERLRREEDERLKREEEEDRRRLEEEKERKRLEEEAIKEIERQKREAERKERERLQREAEAKRRRLDPNNWNSHVYARSDDEVGGLAHHNGVCCVLASPPDSINKDDLQCLASDEDSDIIEILDEGEKLASSIINVESKKGPVAMEVPARVYIPHCQVTDPGDELIIKISINGGEWITKTPILPTPNMEDNEELQMVGVEINPIDKAQIVVTARRKAQTFQFNENSCTDQCTYDRNIKVFVPSDTFSGPTEVNLSVRPITDEILITLAREKECCEQIMSTSSLMTLSCEKVPVKDIEIDLLKSQQQQPGQSTKGKTYLMYRTKENVWKFADAEYKSKGQALSVTLPSGRNLYHLATPLIGVELPQNISKEEALLAAETIYDYVIKTVVRLLVKQKAGPNLAMVHCVRRTDVASRLDELKQLGYTTGADSSREFCLKDGQKLHMSFVGNIGMADNIEGTFVLPFYTYMDSAKREISLHVKDLFKQRDMSEYVGNIVCRVQGVDHKYEEHGLAIEMPLALLKTPRTRSHIRRTQVAFPHYLSALTVFLSWELTERKEHDWLVVLSKLDNKRKLQSLLRQAKTKCDETDERAVCKMMLSDWMKAKPRQDDKVAPICHALQACGLNDLSDECKEFVEYHKTALSTTELQKIAEQVTGDQTEIGEKLGLSPEQIKKCSAENPESAAEQMLAVLEEWRQSDAAVAKGTSAMERLKRVLHL